MQKRRNIPVGFEEAAREATSVRYLINRFHVSYKQTVRWCKELGIEPRWRRCTRRGVVMLTTDTNEPIAVFKSVTDAASFAYTSRTSIVNCLKGKTKSCVGYGWRYADEDAS